MRVIKFIGWAVGWLAALACAAWAFGALYFDFPRIGALAAILFVVLLLAAIIFVRGQLLKLSIVLGAFAVVLSWWLTLKPSNDRAWQPDVAQTAWAEINGNEVTVHNVRNCDYRTETDFTPHWETRRTIGQKYSALAGLYRQYTLIYIVADERDVIRLRTNYRREDVYLYRTLASPAQARERFLEYIKAMNMLHQHPRWYNEVTANCTTSIRTQRSVNERAPWDWRMLINGEADELLYERHAIVTGGLPFSELKQRSLINERARAADNSPDFSQLIREGLPK